jgi:hypothetical protein
LGQRRGNVHPEGCRVVSASDLREEQWQH